MSVFIKSQRVYCVDAAAGLALFDFGKNIQLNLRGKTCHTGEVFQLQLAQILPVSSKCQWLVTLPLFP